MPIITTNQQPLMLNSFHIDPIAGDFDPYASVRDNVVQQMYSPLIPGAPVTIANDNQQLSADDITSILLDCCGDNVDPDAETCMKEIFSHTLANYDPALSVQDVYAVQAAKKLNILLPSPNVIYRPVDVIDAAKQFLSGQITRDGFFANVSFYARVAAFGYYFANEVAFDNFKTWFASEIANIQSVLPADTVKLCSDFQQIKLHGLTESFVIRDDSSQNNEEYSFARVFMFYLMTYEQQLKQNNSPVYVAGHLPFSLTETFCPSTVIIMNVEKHAHAHPNDIKSEWDTIAASLFAKPRVLGLNQIKNLTSIARMAKKMKGLAAACFGKDGDGKHATLRFRKTAPTYADFYTSIERIYRHSAKVLKSENMMKFKKKTFQRPSRREPDNPDRQGIFPGVEYRPDLHIYLDCSGSISEREYQDAIKACIRLAKKMNINIYFTSFSHIMSRSVKLKLANKSQKEIYTEFQKIPKVTGGTDYEQIWHYINRSAVLRQQVSVIISDFEYHAPNHYVNHPKHLYYAPISTSSWSTLTSMAENFAKTMLSICPDIRRHMLI